MISGADISEKNGQVNWQVFANHDIQFLFIKATEGLDRVDSFLEMNMQQARQHGMTFGVYHWFHPQLHAGQQADLFINSVKSFERLLPPVVCLETYYASMDEMERNVRTFLRLLETRIKIRPVIYTSDTFWRTYLPEASWGCDYPLWLDKPGSIWPQQIWPWAGWTFWQYAYQSKLPGISADLGLNWFNGSLEELHQMVVL